MKDNHSPKWQHSECMPFKGDSSPFSAFLHPRLTGLGLASLIGGNAFPPAAAPIGLSLGLHLGDLSLKAHLYPPSLLRLQLSA